VRLQPNSPKHAVKAEKKCFFLQNKGTDTNQDWVSMKQNRPKSVNSVNSDEI